MSHIGSNNLVTSFIGEVKMKFINIKDSQPNEGQNVIAVGTWVGEIYGTGEKDYMGIGMWRNGYVAIDSDQYSTHIVDVTHWMPLPAHPI